MRGDIQKAPDWRTQNSEMICSNSTVSVPTLTEFHMLISACQYPITRACQAIKRDDRKQSGRCRAIFYCGEKSQRTDWKRHRAFAKEINPA